MQDESMYLALIEEKLAKRIRELDEELEAGSREVEEMHDYYWENYTEMDEYGYENFDNSQALFRQITVNNRIIDQRRILKKMQDSPYFGRVDFLYEGEDETEEHYIGIANFSEEGWMKPCVFDWRAPVSSLFYDFEKGPASYEAPMGTISGVITGKWQYKIRRGKLVYAVESDFKIDDDILQEELSSNGSVQLKNIVRSIQKEQNAVIRNTGDSILVLQGAAGSGKTSIALHRIAYLLYHDRKKLTAKDVLVLSPNRVFSNYISIILPELGEENIQEMSFDFFAWKELRGIAPDCEDYLDVLEGKFSDLRKKERKKEDNILSDMTEEGFRRVDKSSREYVQEIYGFCLELEDDLMRIKDIHHKKMHVSAGEIIEYFYNRFPDIPLLARMDAVREYFVDEAETLAGRDFSDPDKRAIQDKFDAMYETKDIYRIYRRFQKRLGIKPLPNVRLEKRRVPYEDLYPMLFMKYQLEGIGQKRKIRHLVIDEMQDYSYMQYMVIAKLFSCRMTIVGDRCQTMGAGQRDVTRFLPEVFGKGLCLMSLNKSYRNTVEIAEYAQGLIGETGIENFGRHGKAPVMLSAGDGDKAADIMMKYFRLFDLQELLRSGGISEKADEERNDAGKDADKGRLYETCGVICLTERESREIYTVLKKKLSEAGCDTDKYLTCIDRTSDQFRKGITVTTFYMAKGLEFDQVFAWYPERKMIQKREDKDLLALFTQAEYITATRALHELYWFV